MRMILYYKGFKIKKTTNREKAEGYYTYNFYVFNKDREEEWSADTLKECLEWIDCY